MPYKYSPIPVLATEEAARFWAMVQKAKGCWLWQGSTSEDGYGFFGLRGKVYKAHRVAYAIKHGGLTVQEHVLHDCDTPSCCRPRHLFLGSQAVNVADMDRKGRRRSFAGKRADTSHYHRGDDHWTRQQPDVVAKGEANGNARLTVDQVLRIRALHEQGHSQHQLAAMFHTSRINIRFIIRRKTWRHV